MIEKILSVTKFRILGLVSLTVALGVTFYGSANQIGPRIMWASDLCPSPQYTCGVIPLWTVIGSFLGAFVALAGVRFLNEGTEEVDAA
jgi:hypothetical protein